MSKRIVITMEQSGGFDERMDPRFGRAPFFLLVDFQKREIVEILKNEAADDAHGAGTGAAALMSEKSVDAVISCRFGPKAHQALTRLGIEMWTAPEGITASEALDKMLSHDLQPMEMKVY